MKETGSTRHWNEELDSFEGGIRGPLLNSDSVEGETEEKDNTELDDLREIREKKSQASGDVMYTITAVMVLSYLLGTLGVSCAWLLVIVAFSWALVKGSLKRVSDDIIRFESLRLHRRRALQGEETCEWLNLLINRWWVFSSTSIFNKLKSTLDPCLQESKPAIIETINLKTLTLGDKTPLLRNARSWDVTNVSRFKPSCSHTTPSGLDRAPTHTLALLCDLVIDSEEFSAVLSARVGHKGMGVDLDIGVEQLVLEGRVLATIFLDMEAPFPHVARLTFSFTERPTLSFRVRILKSVQMMEVPIIKTWLNSLVTDALATAWVDPGHLEVNIHSKEEFVPEQRPGTALAQGVLTVTLKLQKGSSNAGVSSTDDDKWVVLSMGDTTHVTQPMKSPIWQDSSSFLLLEAPSLSNLVVKVKSKKLITTTLTQYDICLQPFCLESFKINETVLTKKGVKVMGGSVPPLYAKFEYTPLKPVNLDLPLTPSLEEVGTGGGGVLYIVVHGADNLICEENSSSPYCLVFSSRKKVTTTHFVPGSTNPKWECGVEIIVADIAAVCLTFVVCSLPKNPKFQDGDLMGIHTINLSTTKLPFVKRRLSLNRNMSTPVDEGVSPAPSSSSITVSLAFRCVPSVAPCHRQELPHFKGMPLPIPGGMGSPSGSPTCLVSNSSPNIYPSSPFVSSTSPSSSLRRGSTGVVEEDPNLKKKSNNHWFNHAKILLGSSHEGDENRQQNLGDILASGLGLIELTILRARDLVARDLNGYSDPYCVVKVNGDFKYRTKVRKKTLDPIWNESFMTHLPKTGQTLNLTLWDHDAFGKDFLGSLSLTEEKIRTISAECSSLPSSTVWYKLEEVKSGSLEIKIKVISEDHEFDTGIKTNSILNGSAIRKESVDSNDSSGSLNLDTADNVMSNGISTFPNGTTTYEYNENKEKSKNAIENINDSKSRIQRTSSNPSFSSNDKQDSSTISMTSSIDHLCTPHRPRKSGAEILASALAIAKGEKSKPTSPKSSLHSSSTDISNSNKVNHLSNGSRINNNSSSSYNGNEGDNRASPITEDRDSGFELELIQPIDDLSNSNLPRELQQIASRCDNRHVPKISLNDQSEDEYGYLEDEPPPVPKRRRSGSSKKVTESGGLRAVKDKFRLFRRK